MGGIHRAIVFLLAGATATIGVAWTCALWSPTRVVPDPFGDWAKVPETMDPDGVSGVHWIEAAFGWKFSTFYAERTTVNGVVDIVRRGPYGGVWHRTAGWPLLALRSRVEVVDSQVVWRNYRGDGAPPRSSPERRRWDLPLDEILYRGIAADDLPEWLHSQHERRLPLIPVPFGFTVNTLVYGSIFALLTMVFKAVHRRFHANPQGFPVVLRSSRNDSKSS